MNSAGYCPLRFDSRYGRLQVDIPAGSTWTMASGVEVPASMMRPSGIR
jgi:hypothetical protein